MNWIESDNASARARARAKCDREEAKRTSLSVSSRMSVCFFCYAVYRIEFRSCRVFLYF